ncbi:hypothetical protein [Pseudomonas veronii]|jgi:hypothetical protein|nr:hypothetical protein [Pseudomonas veronii]NMX50131.1 hypothetical protein [Pseudomonas veronii]
MPAIIDSNPVLSSLEQTILLGFNLISTRKDSRDEDGPSLIARACLS